MRCRISHPIAARLHRRANASRESCGRAAFVPAPSPGAPARTNHRVCSRLRVQSFGVCASAAVQSRAKTLTT